MHLFSWAQFCAREFICSWLKTSTNLKINACCLSCSHGQTSLNQRWSLHTRHQHLTKPLWNLNFHWYCLFYCSEWEFCTISQWIDLLFSIYFHICFVSTNQWVINELLLFVFNRQETMGKILYCGYGSIGHNSKTLGLHYPALQKFTQLAFGYIGTPY